MIVSIKDTLKMVVISVMSCCAVFICTLFLNYNIELAAIKDLFTAESVRAFYDAKKATALTISCCCGGIMLVTTTVMLIFFVKNYIDTHKKELGILKALGYSNLKIAKSFWVFGLSVLIGTGAGFAIAFAIMGEFLKAQDEDHILPEITRTFHPILLVCLVILPTLLFALISVFYAAFKLRTPALRLISDSILMTGKQKKQKDIRDGGTFVSDVKKTTFRSRKSLVFFIIFAAFCFSAMTQMSLGVRELANPMMGYLLLSTGLILAFVILFLAVSTVVNGNTKTVAMMKVFGYSDALCRRSVLDGYRPVAYLGFVIGTFYQYFLLRLVTKVMFKNLESVLDQVPEYQFDVEAMVISLVAFVIVYEAFMYFGMARIRKVSIKEIMLES